MLHSAADEDIISPVASELLLQLQSPSATARLVGALAVAAWASTGTTAPASLTAQILSMLTASMPSQPTPGENTR